MNRRTYNSTSSKNLYAAPRARRPSPGRRAAASHQKQQDTPDDVAVPVLIVDGDPATAKRAAEVLRRNGYETQVAHSAEEAIVVLRTFRPRAIVLELVLPVMSGPLLAQRIKADPDTHDVVRVALTAVRGAEAAYIAEEVGCAACLPKPIDSRTFPKLLLSCLRGTP